MVSPCEQSIVISIVQSILYKIVSDCNLGSHRLVLNRTSSRQVGYTGAVGAPWCHGT